MTVFIIIGSHQYHPTPSSLSLISAASSLSSTTPQPPSRGEILEQRQSRLLSVVCVAQTKKPGAGTLLSSPAVPSSGLKQRGVEVEGCCK
ncbi:hypothetical protein Hanom_Chr05g00414451 [Helianthus anomalus]